MITTVAVRNDFPPARYFFSSDSSLSPFDWGFRSRHTVNFTTKRSSALRGIPCQTSVEFAVSGGEGRLISPPPAPPQLASCDSSLWRTGAFSVSRAWRLPRVSRTSSPQDSRGSLLGQTPSTTTI